VPTETRLSGTAARWRRRRANAAATARNTIPRRAATVVLARRIGGSVVPRHALGRTRWLPRQSAARPWYIREPVTNRAHWIRFRASFAALAAARLAVVLGACDSTTTPPDRDVRRVDAATDVSNDVAPSGVVRLDPAMAEIVLQADGTSTMQSFRVFFSAAAGSPESDVTTEAAIGLADISFATVVGNEVRQARHGGTTRVTATVRGAMGSATLHVRLVGDVVPMGVDPMLPTRFGSAMADPTPAAAPTLEYPLEGAIVPNNVPPMELQWTQVGDSNAYRVIARAGMDVDVTIYGTARELLVDRAVWLRVTTSVRDAPLTFRVEALSADGRTRRTGSTPVSITVAADTVDDSSIYYWESSSGSFRVLDWTTGTNRTLPTNSAAVNVAAGGGLCVACHTVSRDGRRYAFTTGNFSYGSLRLGTGDGGAPTYASMYEPESTTTRGYRASHGAFNPVETEGGPALLLTTAPTLGNNVAGHVRFQLFHPDTGAEVPSNLPAFIASLPASVGHDVLIPDWSDDAHRVVFSAYDSDAMGLTASTTGGPPVLVHAYVRILTDDAVAASIVEARVHVNEMGQFEFLEPRVLVQSPPNPSFDARDNNVLPVYSPGDGALVAFTRSTGWWPIRYQSDPTNNSGRIAIVRRSDAAVIELLRASGPPLTDSTWPQWSPHVGTRYAWLAFSSSRVYGHRMAPGSGFSPACVPQGHTLCKQMWITAIDLRATADGTPLVDPSAVPFWVPGQSFRASAVSPRWTVRALPPG